MIMNEFQLHVVHASAVNNSINSIRSIPEIIGTSHSIKGCIAVGVISINTIWHKSCCLSEVPSARQKISTKNPQGSEEIEAKVPSSSASFTMCRLVIFLIRQCHVLQWMLAIKSVTIMMTPPQYLIAIRTWLIYVHIPDSLHVVHTFQTALWTVRDIGQRRCSMSDNMIIISYAWLPWLKLRFNNVCLGCKANIFANLSP